MKSLQAFIFLFIINRINTVRLLVYIHSALGTSQDYRGDSQMNVIGDLVSCALGYNTARYINVIHGSAIVPLMIFFLTEVLLSIFIRDNMGLIMIQIFTPMTW